MAQIEQNELNNFVKGLVEILVNTNKISKQDSQDLIKNFKNSSKASFDDFLLSENILSKSELLPALGAYYGTPEIDVVGVLFDHNLLLNFPKDFLLSNLIIPLETDQNMLAVVASEPSEELREKIANYVPYVIEFRVGLQQDIIDSIREFYDESYTDSDIDNENTGEHEDISDSPEEDTFEEEALEDGDNISSLIDAGEDISDSE